MHGCFVDDLNVLPSVWFWIFYLSSYFTLFDKALAENSHKKDNFSLKARLYYRVNGPIHQWQYIYVLHYIDASYQFTNRL